MPDLPAAVPFRPLPTLTPLTTPYWTSGEDGRLRIQRCRTCSRYTHPAGPVCSACLGDDVAYEPVAGTGTIYACTANTHPWYPGWETPYAVAIVQLDEQDDLRLTTNVIATPAAEVRIGMRVRVCFEQREDVWLPLFVLDGNDAG